MLSLDGSCAAEEQLDKSQPATTVSTLGHYITCPAKSFCIAFREVLSPFRLFTILAKISFSGWLRGSGLHISYKIHSTACLHWNPMQTAEQGWSCWQDTSFHAANMQFWRSDLCEIFLSLAAIALDSQSNTFGGYHECVGSKMPSSMGLIGMWQQGQSSLGWNPQSQHRVVRVCFKWRSISALFPSCRIGVESGHNPIQIFDELFLCCMFLLFVIN